MQFKFLNCVQCNKPFEAGPLSPHSPAWYYDFTRVYYGYCRSCVPQLNLTNYHRPLTYVTELLSQPALRRGGDSWVACGPVEPLKCPGCKETFTKNGAYDPIMLYECGHLICVRCYGHRMWCRTCQKPAERCNVQDITIAQRYQEFAQSPLNLIAKKDWRWSQLIAGKTPKTACDRCETKFGKDPENLPTVLSCLTVLCPGCHDMMDVLKDCNICGVCLSTHRLWGNKILAELNSGKKRKSGKEIILGDDSEDEPQLENADSVEPPSKMPKLEPIEAEMPQENCSKCLRPFQYDDLFTCEQCENALLCGTCGLKWHNGHRIPACTTAKLAVLQAATIRDLTHKYEAVQSTVRDLHMEIADAQEDLLSTTQENAKLVAKQADYVSGSKISIEMKKTTEEFEKCFADYQPHAQAYKKQLLDLKSGFETFLEGLKEQK